MSALVSALRSAGRPRISAGTMFTTPVTGSYLFRIDQYTRLQEMVDVDTMIESETFSVGGHDWRIRCYAKGKVGYEGFISLDLNHASHDKTGNATADFQMSILDHDGNPWTPDDIQLSSETNGETLREAQNFSSDGYLSWGWEEFMKVEDLDEEEFLKDGCLSILCDVTVLTMRTYPICV